MAETMKRLFDPVLVATGPAALFNYAPGDGTHAEVNLFFVNASGSDATLTIYLYKSGGAASQTTTLWPTVTLSNKGTLSMVGAVMQDGDTIAVASGTNNAISAQGFGFQGIA